MPTPSTKTAWDFMPADWVVRPGCEKNYESAAAWIPPAGFSPVTQLEHARVGTMTPEMRRVAEREPHLTAEQVRDEVAAGRMIIPCNRVHRGFNLDPMAIGRASRTKINANMGASPVSSGTDEEVLKLRWAERWGADTVMDLSTGGDLDECREADLAKQHRARRHRADLFDDHRPAARGSRRRSHPADGGPSGPAGRRLFHDPRRRACGNICRTSRTA